MHAEWDFISQEIYLTNKPYDPEGILGSLTSIVLCLLGVQAGRILTHFKGRRLSIIVRFIIWGVVLVSYIVTAETINNFCTYSPPPPQIKYVVIILPDVL